MLISRLNNDLTAIGISDAKNGELNGHGARLWRGQVTLVESQSTDGEVMGKANFFLLRRRESALDREDVIRSTILLSVDAERILSPTESGEEGSLAILLRYHRQLISQTAERLRNGKYSNVLFQVMPVLVKRRDSP